MQQQNYSCPNCGGQELHSQINSYDTFIVRSGKIHYQSSNTTEDDLLLHCSGCQTKIDFNEEDVIYFEAAKDENK